MLSRVRACHSGSLCLCCVWGCELHALLCRSLLQRVLALLLVGSQEAEGPLTLTRVVCPQQGQSGVREAVGLPRPARDQGPRELATLGAGAGC